MALLLAAAAAFYGGQQLRSALSPGSDVAYAEEAAAATATSVEVAHRAATIDGEPAGEVVMAGQVVARIRTAAGGLSAEERAMVVASRIREWLAAGADPAELVALEMREGGAAVVAGERIIVTITDTDAAASKATPMSLAWMWRDNIAIALGGQPAQPEEAEAAEDAAPTEQPEVTEEAQEAEEAAPAEWVPPEPYEDKIVPILSVLEGVRIGAARVNGPQSKVEQVKAVAQLETDFKEILEIDVYVPITTERPGKNLDRVQGVGVTALGDYRL